MNFHAHKGSVMSRETKNACGVLSRRLLLQKTIAAVSVTAIIARQSKPASASIKISKTAVAYQDHPEGDKRCSKCLQYQAPDSCKMVDGPISPQGFCRIFMPIRQAAVRVPAAQMTG
jgi:hypothetical protein